MSESPALVELQQARALLQANQIDAGIERLTVLANQKLPEAMFELASVLLMLATDADKIAEAMRWLREAEQLGNAPATYRLATASVIESAEALDWSQLASRWQACCRQGHAHALCDAAVYLGRFGTPQQQQQSTAMLEVAAMNGSLVAMALLGERLAEGRLCSADPARANSIRKLAAEVGMPVPAPDPTHGFAAPEPTASPYAGDDWDFGDLQRTTQATHGDCLAPGIALYRHDSLLSEEECLYIQCLGGPDLGPSISVDSQGRRHQNDVRTSWDFIFLPEFEQLYLNLLQRRMADAAGLPVNQAEPLILLRYLPGQEYKLHRDFLPTSLFIPVTAGGSGQRLRTAVSYLNTPPAGGETAFPLLNTDIPAIRGQMVRFDNLLPDGQITRTSLHAGLPVKQGVKWICTLWFRERAHRLQ
ncbi:2OG-Fe(II) oxygenase [Arenimonas sp.]|jgi:hypothetical protein|uniref:2OG-Fe(II) oxygenase n=1 Tax=Arenimonas sp. TaxID=1872635 RepID=UPI0037C00CC5